MNRHIDLDGWTVTFEDYADLTDQPTVTTCRVVALQGEPGPIDVCEVCGERGIYKVLATELLGDGGYDTRYCQKHAVEAAFSEDDTNPDWWDAPGKYEPKACWPLAEYLAKHNYDGMEV